jgi:hypothetical protein
VISVPFVSVAEYNIYVSGVSVEIPKVLKLKLNENPPTASLNVIAAIDTDGILNVYGFDVATFEDSVLIDILDRYVIPSVRGIVTLNASVDFAVSL